MQTKLSMNQKPETDGTDWKTPKIDLKLDMEALALCVGKLQYQDLLLFLEAQERFNTATRYLKYRPSINEYQGHYKQWYVISNSFVFLSFICCRDSCFSFMTSIVLLGCFLL